MAETARSFVTLDGLRGIAALIVVTRHGSAYFPSAASSGAISTGPYFASYLAVDFFFVLSGFVLAHAYRRRLRDGMTARAFMVRRLIRLYPLFLLALVIATLVAIFRQSIGQGSITSLFKNLVPELLFLPAPARDGSAYLFPLDIPAWSLFFELAANLMFGLAARYLNEKRLVIAVLALASILAVSVVSHSFGFGGAGEGAMADGATWNAAGAGLLRATYAFFAGVLLYAIWRVRRPPIVLPFVLAAALLALVLFAHPPREYQAAYDLVAVLALFPALIWLASGTLTHGIIGRVCRRLGALSYAIYVLQAPLYALSLVLFDRVRGAPDQLPRWSGIMFIALVVAAASIADRYVDGPARGFLMRHWRKTRMPQANKLTGN